MKKMTHKYVWKNNEKRKTLFNRACVVLNRGKMNSICIEFENGRREIVSRYSVRRIKNDSCTS
jgi:hypothetical protein